jgi:ribosomal protein S18 acetylase RimI-like enzyme
MLIKPAITVRPRQPSDEPFLFSVYCSVREAEFDALDIPAEQRLSALHMQYETQHMAYSARYPGSDYEVICFSGEPVGWVWVASLRDALHLVDIGLLPSARNQGVGTWIVHKLQQRAMAEGKPIRCNVHQENPGSLRFHQRLGFQIVHEDSMDLKMEWHHIRGADCRG